MNSPRVNPEVLSRYEAAGAPRCALDYRGTGRSTVQALRLLAKASENPGMWIAVEDHHGTRAADLHLAHAIMALAVRARLEGYEVKGFDVGRLFLRCTFCWSPA